MTRFGKDAGAVGFAIYLSALESLAPRRASYDVDALLLYSADSSPEILASAVRELTDKGMTVQVQQEIPPMLRYRTLMKLTEGGVITLEKHD